MMHKEIRQVLTLKKVPKIEKMENPYIQDSITIDNVVGEEWIIEY